jgi:hypothetical protein
MTLVLAGLAVAPFSGCSGIGYMTGYLIDHSTADYRDESVHQAAYVDRGHNICVITLDDSTYQGEFEGIAVMDSADYDDALASLADSLPEITFPASSEPVTVHTYAGFSMTGRFQGFDVWFTKSKLAPEGRNVGQLTTADRALLECCLIKNDEDQNAFNFLLQDIESIETSSGDTLDGGHIFALAELGAVPTRSFIVIKKDNTLTEVQINHVKRLKSVDYGYAQWIGLGIGAAIDGAIIAFIIAIATMGPLL